MPEDWSHHHLLFSSPTTTEQSFRLANDTRYVQQWVRRYLSQGRTAAGPPAATTRVPIIELLRDQGLWGRSLSGTGSAWASPGTGRLYPAKFGFYDTTSIQAAAAPRSPDYVVYGLKSGTIASTTGTFTGHPTNGQTVTIGGSAVLTASASTAATGTVTFNSEPLYGDTVTVGSNTYIWHTPTATAATGTVTFSSEPHYQDTITVGSNTLHLAGRITHRGYRHRDIN